MLQSKSVPKLDKFEWNQQTNLRGSVGDIIKISDLVNAKTHFVRKTLKTDVFSQLIASNGKKPKQARPKSEQTSRRMSVARKLQNLESQFALK